MRKQAEGTLVTIRADHEFDAAYHRRVFLGGDHRTDAQTWATQKCEECRAMAAYDDPRNADIIWFSASLHDIMVEVES